MDYKLIYLIVFFTCFAYGCWQEHKFKTFFGVEFIFVISIFWPITLIVIAAIKAVDLLDEV